MAKKGFVNWLLKGSIIQKRPCEKVSYVFAFAIAVSVYLLYLISANLYMVPIHYLFLSGFGVGAGYVGVLYYRIMHHKKPYFIFNFWGKY